MKVKYLILFTLAGFVVAFDQVTKLIVSVKFDSSSSLPLVKNVVHITLQKNVAGIFDLFQNVDPLWRLAFFLIIPTVALFIIVIIFISSKTLSQSTAIGLALIAGGSLGNMLDRIRFQSVIGFLDFKWILKYHPINIADLSLFLGCIILIVCIIVLPRKSMQS